MKRLFIFALVIAPLSTTRVKSDEIPVAAFFDAIRAVDVATVRKLAEAQPKLLNAQDPRSRIGPTPIQAAIHPRCAAVLDVLLELGADPNARNARGEPAMLFLRSQSPETATRLLNAGGDVNIAAPQGLTLLHYTCADSRSHTLAKFLIQHGADVNAHGPLGVTPLHTGTALGAASFLIPAGGDPNLPDWLGQSAHFKVRSARQLESLGTPTTTADFSGWTLLHQFVWQGNLDAVKWLLSQETLARQINSVDDEGTSPLAAAARFGETEIVDTLLAAGADPSLRDERGWTAAEIARNRGFAELANRLTRAEASSGVYSKRQASRRRAVPPPQATTKPGKLVADPPTLRCLGFRWWIEGDANRNASCDVDYRVAGPEPWTAFYPALRIGGETSDRGWTNPNMIAGSVVDLEPGTNYEVRLTLRDPDNAAPIVKALKLVTRAEPAVDFTAASQLHVGDKAAHFATVQAAYDAAQPGDVIVIHAGEYQEDLVMNKAATAEKPIVIRGEGDNVVLRGIGNDLINVDGAKYHVFENLTLIDADNGFLARGQTHALTVRRCRFRNIGRCFFALSQRNRGFLIYDNDMDGPIEDWHPRRTIKSQGVWIAGQGHAIFHNRIRGFWDGLSIKGEATDDPEMQNCAIDFYNNDLSEFLDDAIELDYGMHNLRCMRNRIRNTFMGISTQPVEGGPA
jgi:ankyrin repeat protein